MKKLIFKKIFLVMTSSIGEPQIIYTAHGHHDPGCGRVAVRRV